MFYICLFKFFHYIFEITYTYCLIIPLFQMRCQPLCDRVIVFNNQYFIHLFLTLLNSLLEVSVHLNPFIYRSKCFRIQ